MEEIVSSEKVIASNEFVVGSVPTVLYIPDYITAAEEDQLLNNIYQAPISKWKSLKNRRLQNWGGVVHEKGLLAQDYFLHGIKDCEFQRYDEAVNVTNSLKSEAQLADMVSGLNIDGEAGDDNVIHRTATRVSLTCRVVTKVHKHLIKL
ncbi:UNVERIFIED_CONTAM: Alpha-ketoglutarate-dependent dioxygenase alkB6 [Sesamum radiatum]|uniref:Alpha-ketoglutarate-dependent dioxygenase alkB6 n=1 Tax=Sesamum radiatum TaxID=300843 RepID=A0AAW2UM65_SESRA